MTNPMRSECVKNEIFPVSLYSAQWENTGAFNQELLTRIKKERDVTQGVKISNQGGWQSPLSLFEITDPVILRFKDMCMDVIVEFLKKHYDLTCNPKDLHWEAWANINTRGNSNRSHDHTKNENQWSWIYYLIDGDPNETGNRGWTVFEDRQLTGQSRIQNRIPSLKSNQNKVLPREHVIIPKMGKMMIFPGSLWHRVEAFRGGQERVTIAGNFKCRELGVYDFESDNQAEALKAFMWYYFRGPMLAANYLKRKIGL